MTNSNQNIEIKKLIDHLKIKREGFKEHPFKIYLDLTRAVEDGYEMGLKTGGRGELFFIIDFLELILRDDENRNIKVKSLINELKVRQEVVRYQKKEIKTFVNELLNELKFRQKENFREQKKVCSGGTILKGIAQHYYELGVKVGVYEESSIIIEYLESILKDDEV